VIFAYAAGWQATRGLARFPPICQAEAGQRHAGQADAKFLQRLPPRCCLSQLLGQFIEFVIHTFPFVLLFH
jgi:hypothetical protein